MDGLSLYKISRILNKNFKGHRLNGISVFENNFILNLYNKGNYQLCFQTDFNSWISIVDLIPNLKSNLQLPLNGSLIKNFATKSFDRILFVDLNKRKPSGKVVEFKIVFEAVGSNSNIFILNDKGKIIFSANKRNIDADRDISVGKTYQPFKSNKMFDLINIGQAKNFDDLTGFYSVTAKYAKMITKDCENFKSAAEKILFLLNNDDYFYENEKNQWIPFEIPNYKNKQLFYNVIFKKNMEKAVSNTENRKQKLKKYFQKQLKKYDTLKNKLIKDYNNALNFKKIEKEAILLKNNIHILLNNIGEVKLLDYTENGVEEIDYIIKPDIDYEKEIDRLFKRSRKMKRSIDLIKQRIDEISKYIDAINDDLFFLEIANDTEINELFFNIFTKQKKVKRRKSKAPFYMFKFGEAEFYVGRNSVVNHELVFNFAKPNDIWFHAQKIPSAHVILRKNNKITDEDIVFGAKLSAFYSKNSKENKVVVDYTLKKYVKHPKNSPDGFVIYVNFKSLTVTPFSDEEIEKFKIN